MKNNEQENTNFNLINILIEKNLRSMEFIREYSFKTMLMISAGGIVALLSYLANVKFQWSVLLLALLAMVSFFCGLLIMIRISFFMLDKSQPLIKSQITALLDLISGSKNLNEDFKKMEEIRSNNDKKIIKWLNYGLVAIFIGIVFGVCIVILNIFFLFFL